MSRIALVCSGLGYVPRGFERYTRELFDVTCDALDVTLYAAEGAGAREIALRVPRRTGPLSMLGPSRAYRLELLAFAARLLPHLYRDRVELVHYSEPYLGNVLAAARRRLGLRFRLLLTDGLGLSARSASRADLLHVLTPIAAEAARAGGRPHDTVFSIPHGLHVDAFAAGVTRAAAREQLGLPVEGRLLLDVAALNARHKRIDALIAEGELLPADWTLAVAGAPEEPELLELGRRRLGSRFVNLRLTREQMPLAYTAADVFAHAAHEEGFGLAVVEAMASGLPVVVHRSPHFAWLVGDERQLVDLAVPGALAAAVLAPPANAGERNRQRARELDWGRIAPAYVEMYRRALDQAGMRP